MTMLLNLAAKAVADAASTGIEAVANPTSAAVVAAVEEVVEPEVKEIIEVKLPSVITVREFADILDLPVNKVLTELSVKAHQLFRLPARSGAARSGFFVVVAVRLR